MYGQRQANFIKLNKQFLEDKDIVNLSIENQILCNKIEFVCEVCELQDQLKKQIRSKIKIEHTKVEQIQQQFLNYQFKATNFNFVKSRTVNMFSPPSIANFSR
ncbi:unnamed protein product [Paramecium sonneborni]|uniref:Uncharacterized protein n=1 Tax=Paramecium sonneborni TaxID=65129 RepID=A0A8S1Q9U5_9CILI|nr:unnamed protein product [Paramecium sonneborni]